MDEAVAFAAPLHRHRVIGGYHQRVGQAAPVVDNSSTGASPNEIQIRQKAGGIGKGNEITEAAPARLPSVNPEHRALRGFQQPVIHRHVAAAIAFNPVDPQLQFREHHSIQTHWIPARNALFALRRPKS